MRPLCWTRVQLGTSFALHPADVSSWQNSRLGLAISS